MIIDTLVLVLNSFPMPFYCTFIHEIIFEYVPFVFLHLSMDYFHGRLAPAVVMIDFQCAVFRVPSPFACCILVYLGNYLRNL